MDAIGDKVFSELFQAKAMIVIFGILGVAALIGTYWNPVAIICFGNVCNYGFMWFE